MTSHEVFLRYSADKLLQNAQRIAICLDQLSAEQIWTRGSENENAIGNLALHLCGNVRQWIGAGVAGRPDDRARDAEFAARGESDSAALRQMLLDAVDEAAAVIRAVSPEQMLQPIAVQSYHVTVLEAVYHVVEHFSGHTGQIVFATKLLTGADLGFYQHLRQPAHKEKIP